MGRLVLAHWVLFIPGLWLGHLLIKQELRLPEALGVRFSLALGVSYLALLLRKPFSPDAPALVLTVLSLVVTLVYTFRPQRRGDGPRVPGSSRAAGQLVGFTALVLLALHLWAGGSASLRPDSFDHIVTAEALGSPAYSHSLFGPTGDPAPAGQPAFDSERSLYHPWLDLLARTSGQTHQTVFRFLPGFLVPLLFLSLCLLGGVILKGRWLGYGAGLLGMLFLALGADGEGLRWTGHIDRMALIPFWSALALLLDGMEDPRPRHIAAWTLVAFAATATHLGLAPVLGLVFLLLTLRALTSVSRVQEGLPFLMAYFVPGALLLGVYCALRAYEAGSVNAFASQATGLLVLGNGKWILDPELLSFPEQLAFVLCLTFLPVLFRQGLQYPRIFFLITAPFALKLIAYNPWLLPPLESLWGSNVHLLPWLFPMPIAVVALAYWAINGLRRSQGFVWIRVSAALGTGVIVISAVVMLCLHFPYTPGRIGHETTALTPLQGPHQARLRVARPEPILAHPVDVASLALTHAPGDTVTLRVNWPQAIGSGNRIRVELRLSQPPQQSRSTKWRNSVNQWWDWIRHRESWASAEQPFASDSLNTTVRLPLPPTLPPGSYEVRVAALPGRHSPDRIRNGYLFLDQTQTTLAIVSN